jgi:23S rRNA (guanosine2251-2'-O)-methyltransferase
MLVYGKNVLKELINNNTKVSKAFVYKNFEDMNLINKLNCKINYLEKKELDKMIDGVHQGVILQIDDYKYFDIDELGDKIVMLDHIEDPHNLGAIIRTCEAAGVKTVIIPKDRQVPINSTVMKTSVGTLDNVKIASVTNLVNAINKLKDAGYWIVGTALDNSVDYRSIDYSGKIALVIGNEGNGISNIVEKNCDFIAKIPMYGKTNSLNASVAAGIMIYEVIRNRT